MTTGEGEEWSADLTLYMYTPPISAVLSKRGSGGPYGRAGRAIQSRWISPLMGSGDEQVKAWWRKMVPTLPNSHQGGGGIVPNIPVPTEEHGNGRG